MKRVPRLGWLALSWVAGCGSPIDAPSAYETAQFLCDDAHTEAWNAAIQACRTSRALGETCAGVASFRGVVDRQPIVVAMRARKAVFTPSINADGDRLRSLQLVGPAPYFSFAFYYEFFADGRLDTPPASAANLTLEARGGNYLVGLADNNLAIQLDQPGEFAFTLSSRLARGGTFEGCFHVFLTSPTSD